LSSSRANGVAAIGEDYGIIFQIAVVAFLLMLGVRRGERADQAPAEPGERTAAVAPKVR
jgi:hypothetical protein